MRVKKISQGSSVALDLIRGVSAQLVVFGHGISFFGIIKYLQPPYFPWMQNVAVLIFFLVSGFVISYVTFKKREENDKYSFSSYFIDRFSRIYVVFIPALFFVFLLDYVSFTINSSTYNYSLSFNFLTFFGNLLMFQDFPIFFEDITSFGSGRPFWTLAIEWWIYLLFGVVYFFFLDKDKIKVRYLLLLLCFSIVPSFNLISGRGNALTIYWLYGVLVFWLLNQGVLDRVSVRKKVLFLFVFIALGILRIYIVMDAYDAIFAFILAVIFLIFLDLFEKIDLPSSLTSIIRFNASFSYTLYLIHYSIYDFIVTHLGKEYNPYVLFILGFVLSNIISMSIGRYIEVVITRNVREYLYRSWKLA